MKPLTEPWFRLGYVTPHPLVDNVPYQFYRIAPDGVMLMLANLEIADYTIEAVAHELPLFCGNRAGPLRAFRGAERPGADTPGRPLAQHPRRRGAGSGIRQAGVPELELESLGRAARRGPGPAGRGPGHAARLMMKEKCG